MLKYLAEIIENRNALLATCLGLIAGTTSTYFNNIFSPHLLSEFGWSRAELASVGSAFAAVVVCLPISGRLADSYGLRKLAIVGVIGLPLVFVGLALQQGHFLTYFLLSLIQMVITTCLVGIVIYGRLIVRTFARARGLALGIAACAPPLAASVGAPLLSEFAERFGWRAGYFLLAGVAAAAGACALRLIPADFRDRDVCPAATRAAARDYPELFRARPFRIIFSAMLLCNLHFTMQTTQLELVVRELGAQRAQAALMISSFAIGVIIGRIACGLALDRFSPQRVATICFLIPSGGLALLASGAPNLAVLGIAVMALGFSIGAEGDIALFLVSKYLRPSLLGTALGLIASAMALSALLGALLLSRVVAHEGSYALFLRISSVTTLAGGLSFLLLRRPEETR